MSLITDYSQVARNVDNAEFDVFDFIIVGGGAYTSLTIISAHPCTPQEPLAAFSPRVSPSAQTYVSSSSRLVKGVPHPCYVIPLFTSPSGKVLFESRAPAGFPELYHSQHDYDFYTVPQQHAGNKKKYWPRGISSVLPLFLCSQLFSASPRWMYVITSPVPSL